MTLTKNDILNKKMINPHLLILGNNQTVLKDLKATYEQTVSLIYIDPPYNRGDNFKFYKDDKKHSEWIETIQATILEMKDLL